MGTNLKLASVVLGAVLGVGCGSAEYSLSELGGLGTEFKGMEFENGTELNGIKLNGIKLNGIKLNGIKLNGTALHVSDITNGNLTAEADDLTFTFSSNQLTGSTVVATFSNGDLGIFRIDGVTYRSDLGTNAYNISSFDGSTWVPTCGYDPTGYYAPVGVPIPALAMSDTWDPVTGGAYQDPNQFTFGCLNAAIAKCVLWGYQRWSTKQECVSTGNCKTRDMSWVHEACTRLVRADYCGNNVAHTRNGTSLDVYDALGLQTRDGVAGYSLEAEWRSDGAHCIQHTRWTKAVATDDTAYATDYDYLVHTCPSRLAVNDSSCSDMTKTHYFTQYGYNDSIDSRSFLREETYLH